MFLHGIMGSAANWRRIAKAFEDEYQVLTYDQRGHGRSFKPPHGYRPSDYAQDLKLILDDLGWEKIFLVGHSMGGRNAIEFAARSPQRVEGLVIEDIGPEASSDSIHKIEKLLELVPTPFPNRESARRFFEGEYPEMISFYPQAHVVAKFLLSNIEQKENGQWDWRFDKGAILESLRVGRNEDRWDAFVNLQMPVLIVRGEHSRDLSREVFARMQASLPSAKAVEIPSAGHWVHFDQPEAFIQALREFFLTCRRDSVY